MATLAGNMSRSSNSLTKDKKRKKLISDAQDLKNITDAPPTNDLDRKGRLSRSESDKEVESSAEQDSALAYVVLSKDESEQILLMNVNAMESKLRDKFHLDSETSVKDAAVLDYYVGATYWGQQQGYTMQQLSILFTIVHHLLNTIKDNQVPLVGLITEVRNMIATVCTDTKNPEDNIFSTQQSKAVTDYLSSSLFQHYRLYQFVFSMPQDEEIITQDLSVEVPVPDGVQFPKSLDEGLPEEIFTSISTLELSHSPAVTEGQKDTETELMSPTEIELPPNVNDIFEKLTAKDVKAVISEACAAMLDNLEKDVQNKITKQEAAALEKLSKVKIIPPASAKSSDGEQ